jgi:molecular chaperone HscB
MAADPVPSHFELFDLPPSFVVDTALLELRYRELQRNVHPDRFVNAGDRERLLSVHHAARINEAYRTLKDPLLRGRYLLELAGYAFDDEHHTTRDAGFLMEQMELREALSGVRGEDDAFGVLAGIMDRIRADLSALESRLGDQLAAGDNDAQAAAADTLVKMQFFRKLQDEAVELEVSLEDEMA